MRTIRKIGGAVMLILAVFLLVVTISGLASLPAGLRQINETIMVRDGCIHPENQGKPVILVFDPSTMGNACDSDLGLYFESPCIRRSVDVFTYKGTEDGEMLWGWEKVYDLGDTELCEKFFTGSQNGPGLRVDPALLVSLPTGRSCDLNDLTPISRAKVEQEYLVYGDLDRVYFSKASSICFHDDLTGNSFNESDYQKNEGQLRFSYSAMYEDQQSPAAFLGIQQGDTLMKDPESKAGGYYEHFDSKEDMSAELIRGIVLGALLTLAGTAVLAFFGIRMMMPPKNQ